MEFNKEKLRCVPSIDRLISAAGQDTELQKLKHNALARLFRQITNTIRTNIINGSECEVSEHAVLSAARKQLAVLIQPRLCRVINGTGIVLHTNLGRAPLGQRAARAVNDVLTCYSTLEYDVATGKRGSRYAHVADRIAAVVGAEDAIAVNNNAAAILVALSTLAAGKEVIVSRGELVEIGGSFRIPEVIRCSGAKLVEVGTTNKTRLADYEAAITPETAGILKVHTSNYRIVGFTAQPSIDELAKLAQDKRVPLIEDLGSGAVISIASQRFSEPTVSEQLSAGVDIITMSGDKLLGAGQAGIIAGRKSYIEAIKKNPLLRAMRIDKLSLAALEGTLIDYQLGLAEQEVPVYQMLNTPNEKLKKQADSLIKMIQKEAGVCTWQAAIVPVESQAGGGALPEVGISSWAVRLKSVTLTAAEVEQKLRLWTIPIIARIQDETIQIDVRCLSDEDMEEIARACWAIAKK